MANRFLLYFAFLPIAASTALYSQIPTDTGDAMGSSVQTQQNTTTGCTDAMLAAGEDCSLLQQQTTQGQITTGTSSSGVPTPANLGAVQPDSSTSGLVTLREIPLQQFSPSLPTEFQKFVAATTGQFLQIYGENLFLRVPSTFAPSNQVPVPSDYVIAPADELRVRIWGQVNFTGNLTVDRSGNIYLPQVGPVQVAGLQFAAVDPQLRAAVAKLYRNFDLSVDIGRIRSMQIYVSGEARRPGAYTLSSLSSLVDAIFATGGPSAEGSLRHIQLKREGRVVTDFDLYDLLIRGDKSKDVRLLPEDIIYIPPVGPQVAITGSVKSPAIYELVKGETAGDLIALAGQTTAVASNDRISLDRVEQNQSRSTLEIDFNATGLATVLADGDILRTYAILPAYDKTVTLRGSVANPGRFSWHPGMQLSELIPDRDSLVSRDYWWQRSHLGLPTPEFEPEISALGEKPQQNPNAPNAPASPIYPASQASRMQATVTGALKSAKTSDSYGGSSGGPEQNTSIASGLTQTAQAAQTPTTVDNAPAPRNEVGLPDLQIDWNYAVIERIDPKSLKPSLIPFDLGKLVLDHDPSANMTLEPGDTVTIFSQSDIRVPLDEQVKYIDLEGEFVHSGFYSVQQGETLRDVVRRAGGVTPRAYLYGSEFTRKSARAIQQMRLDEYVRELTLNAERGTQSLAMTAGNAASASNVAASLEVTKDMISRLGQIKATGRIVLQFKADSSSVDDIPDISLENGDKFVISTAPQDINVVGAVYDQNVYVYQKGKTLGYYLELAGGTSRNADWAHAFLVRADGSVISRKHLPDNTGFWKESFASVKLNPGDALVVPEKTIRPTAAINIIEWSQIFSQLALGAAAINVL